LIVIPALRTLSEVNEEKSPTKKEDIVRQIKDWLSRVTSIVLGPGLGRDSLIHECVKEIISFAKEKNLPLVIDGDGIWAVENDPNLIYGYNKATITANFNEYTRLCNRVLRKNPPPAVNESEDSRDLQISTAMELAKGLGNVTLVCKGSIDIITDGTGVISCKVQGGLRRCGGLGDVLAGTIGTFATWADLGPRDSAVPPMMLAAYGGCFLTRDCANFCFREKGRSMVAADLVQVIGQRFQAVLEHKEPDQ